MQILSNIIGWVVSLFSAFALGKVHEKKNNEKRQKEQYKRDAESWANRPRDKQSLLSVLQERRKK